MDIKVSIIVPIYNVEKYLNRCMQSLLNQTLKEIEIIMVDDGSPDRCPQMCDEYATKDKRIKVIHKQNGGLGYARNSGMEIATGRYIAFIDSDDYVDVDMMEKLYDVASKRSLQAVFCGTVIIGENNEVVGKHIEEDVYTECRSNEKCRVLALESVATRNNYSVGTKHMISVWHSVYDLSFLRQNSITFCSERDFISEDMIFDIDFFSKANRIAFVPESYYYYCYNGTSLSRTFNLNLYDRCKRHYKELLRRLSVNKFSETDLDVAHKYMIVKTYDYIQDLFKKESNRSTRNKKISEILSDSIWKSINHSSVRRYLQYRYRISLFLFANKLYWITKIVFYLICMIKSSFKIIKQLSKCHTFSFKYNRLWR